MIIDTSLLVKDLQSPEVQRDQAAQTLLELSLDDFDSLLLQTLSVVENTDESGDHGWLQAVCEALSHRLRVQNEEPNSTRTGDSKSGGSQALASIATTITKLYAALGPHHAPRYQLLSCLAQMETGEPAEANLAQLADTMVDDPPRGIGPAAAPLVHLCRQLSATAIAALYPRLLDALANPDVAPAVLDLASFFTRTGQLATHPASQRVDGLLTLAEAVVADLEPIQNAAAADEEELRSRQERVARSLPLAISLCDALGLIGDDRAMPTLQRIGELQHRRLRVESAAARLRLAQKSEHEIDATKAAWLENAVQDLVAMAAEPSVRMRVLAYAEELDVSDEVAEELTTPVARAEGELVAFLAQPTQMGLPPDRLELADSKTLYWPSYEEPRNCYLFRYEYDVQAGQSGMGSTTYANLGLAGPMSHAFHTDMTELPLADVYATFAGWQADHEDIKHREIDPGAELELLPAAVRQLVSRVPEEFTAVQPRIFGLFFGQPVIVATAQKGTAMGSFVIDEQMREPNWFPMLDERSVGPGEAWLIYKGRRLLDSFNDDWTEGC